MPPMCTPEKAKNTTQQANNIDEYYFIPEEPQDEEHSTESSDLDDSGNEEDRKMDELLETFPDLDKYFDLHGKVGEGTFSTVYVAALKSSNEKKFAIKNVVPTCHPERIRFELNCLQKIGGVDNVAGIHLCVRNLNNVIFVMPFQRHDSFSEYVHQMDAEESKFYMKNLLIALARVHDFQIIHRDIKPSNFLYDRIQKKFLLVDFGLAQKQAQTVRETKVCESTTSKKRKRDGLSSPLLDGQALKRAALQPVNLHHHMNTPTKSVVPVVLSFAVKQNKENNRPNNFPISKEAPQSSTTSKQPGSITSTINNVITATTTQQMQFQQQPMGQKTTQNNNKKKYACGCYGKAKVCSTCMVQPPIQASRAGTPGFRPPEVLFKVPHQTTAVDIWASGIIMLTILSKCTSFFSCPNDIAALIELVTIFGFENVNKIARKFGRYFICSERKPELDLRKICCTLRSRGDKIASFLAGKKCTDCEQFQKVCLCKHVPLHEDVDDEFPQSAYDLLHRLLDLNPKTRITAREALQHPFFLFDHNKTKIVP